MPSMVPGKQFTANLTLLSQLEYPSLVFISHPRDVRSMPKKGRSKSKTQNNFMKQKIFIPAVGALFALQLHIKNIPNFIQLTSLKNPKNAWDPSLNEDENDLLGLYVEKEVIKGKPQINYITMLRREKPIDAHIYITPIPSQGQFIATMFDDFLDNSEKTMTLL